MWEYAFNKAMMKVCNKRERKKQKTKIYWGKQCNAAARRKVGEFRVIG